MIKRHLYNSTLTKITWFIRRFGWKELLFKPLRTLFAPWILRRLPRRQFQFRDHTLDYFYHPYNATWAGERIIEVSIAKSYLDAWAGKRILEVGNVMSHYFPIQHEIVDKFEPGPNILNEDILRFNPSHTYDLILSISTFEHIGFDDDSGSENSKIEEALQKCRSMLKPEGLLIITVPLGYNPDLDRLIRENRLNAVQKYYFVRTGATEWLACDQATAFQHPYKSRFPYANSLLIAEFSSATVH